MFVLNSCRGTGQSPAHTSSLSVLPGTPEQEREGEGATPRGDGEQDQRDSTEYDRSGATGPSSRRGTTGPCSAACLPYRCHSQTEDRLSSKTKRTILENEKIRNELQYQSRESTKLATKFRNLEKENALLRKRLSESREAEADAAKRMHARQRQVASALPPDPRSQMAHTSRGAHVSSRAFALRSVGSTSSCGPWKTSSASVPEPGRWNLRR